MRGAPVFFSEIEVSIILAQFWKGSLSKQNEAPQITNWAFFCSKTHLQYNFFENLKCSYEYIGRGKHIRTRRFCFHKKCLLIAKKNKKNQKWQIFCGLFQSGSLLIHVSTNSSFELKKYLKKKNYPLILINWLLSFKKLSYRSLY